MKTNLGEAFIADRVDRILRRLQLDGCKNTMVGGFMRKGLSGGERKRTSIGYEMITEPSLMILDEPTSGLDSFTAVRICRTLCKLAWEKNKTIVATIHQPSSKAFSYCDRLILLSDGHVVYQGLALECSDYFGYS